MDGSIAQPSIHRYTVNQCTVLQAMTGCTEAKVASRIQLPRLLDRLNWQALNHFIDQYFHHQIERTQTDKWVAIDGKVLRGTLHACEKQAVVLAVTHQSKVVLGQGSLKWGGTKSSAPGTLKCFLKQVSFL